MSDNVEREIQQGYASFADETGASNQSFPAENLSIENSTEYKLRECFDELVVYKVLK